jgi:hypothetical protein
MNKSITPMAKPVNPPADYAAAPFVVAYRVEGEGQINAAVNSVEEASAFLRDHALGKLPHMREGFGSSELLTIPTVYNREGSVVARLAYNGTVLP